MNPFACAKVLLLDPKSFNPKDLQRVGMHINKLIGMTTKHRLLEIEQTSDKKYTISLTVSQDKDEMFEVPNERSNQIISHIELNPEDIIIIQKFLNKCIDNLLNL